MKTRNDFLPYQEEQYYLFQFILVLVVCSHHLQSTARRTLLTMESQNNRTIIMSKNILFNYDCSCKKIQIRHHKCKTDYW